MGDWESTWGMGNSGESIGKDPCWNDEWEQELRAQGYRPVKEWNQIGHVVKKGEKGKFLPCARQFVFKESQTRFSLAFLLHMQEIARLDAERDLRIAQCAAQNDLRHFHSFSSAAEWAKGSSGGKFSRCVACGAFTNGEKNVTTTRRRRVNEQDFGESEFPPR